jgi:DNA cross-link repair 1A protein
MDTPTIIMTTTNSTNITSHSVGDANNKNKMKPITVTLLDANHCPGAVMFLFDIRGKRSILHVGDFRWNREVMLRQHPIRQIVSQQTHLDDLFLDTTYCDAKYTLPSQTDTVSAAIDLFQRYKTEKAIRTLHLFGAYTIGKERLFLSVAETFGLKVYVDSSRYRVMSALEWPKERMKIFTTNREETCIWVVPLGHINMKKLPDYFPIANAKPFAPAYHQIVGYRPTGWSLSSKPSAGIVSTRKNGHLIIHSLPYSEHSSFPELIDCLACLRPTRIVPTVNASNKSQQQVETLWKALRNKQTEIRLESLNPKIGNGSQ